MAAHLRAALRALAEGGEFADLVDLTFIVSLAEGLAFVVGVLTLAEGYFHFSKAFLIDKETQGDNGLTGILGRFLQFAYLASLQQQFAVTLGFMISIGAEPVLGYMHLLDIHLPMFYRTIGINERSLSFPNRLNLRTVQHDTGRIAIKNDVLKLRFLV